MVNVKPLLDIFDDRSIIVFVYQIDLNANLLQLAWSLFVVPVIYEISMEKLL